MGVDAPKTNKSGMQTHLFLIFIVTRGMSGSSAIFHVSHKKQHLSGKNTAHKMCFHFLYKWGMKLFSF
jgi:uncharacterized protein YceK